MNGDTRVFRLHLATAISGCGSNRFLSFSWFAVEAICISRCFHDSCIAESVLCTMPVRRMDDTHMFVLKARGATPDRVF